MKSSLLPLLLSPKEVEIKRKLPLYSQAVFGACVYGSDCSAQCQHHVRAVSDSMNGVCEKCGHYHDIVSLNIN